LGELQIKKTLEVENLFIYNKFLGAFGKVKNNSFMIDFLKVTSLDYFTRSKRRE